MKFLSTPAVSRGTKVLAGAIAALLLAAGGAEAVTPQHVTHHGWSQRYEGRGHHRGHQRGRGHHRGHRRGHGRGRR